MSPPSALRPGAVCTNERSRLGAAMARMSWKWVMMAGLVLAFRGVIQESRGQHVEPGTAPSDSQPQPSRAGTRRLCATGQSICTCERTFVRCSHVQAHRLPAIPRTAQWLSIRDSNLRTLQANAFSNVTSLARLNIVHSRLLHIHRDAFVGLRHLILIQVEGNLIATLHPGTFRNLPSLETVNLQDNHLAMVPRGTFQQLPLLSTVMLDGNRISRLEHGAFDSVSTKRLKSLALHNNELSCNCSIRYVLQLHRRISADHDDIIDDVASSNPHILSDETMRRQQLPWRCASPVSLAERNVLSLTEKEIGCSPPTARIHPPVTAEKEGKFVRFVCNVTGQPPPEIRWTVNGRRIQPYRRRSLGQASTRFLALGNFLWVRAVMPRDEGIYRCTARNDAGEAGGSARLIVIAKPQPPSVRLHPRAEVALVTGTAKFHCTSRNTEDLPSTMSWFWNGYEISSQGSAVRDRYHLLDNGTLRLLDIRDTDRGIVSCQVRNQYGNDIKHANLSVEVPMPVRDLTVLSALSVMNNATAAALHLQEIPSLAGTSLADWLNMPDEQYEFTKVMTLDATNQAHAEEASTAIQMARLARKIIASGRWNPTGQRQLQVDSSPPGYDNSFATKNQLRAIERLADCRIRHQPKACNRHCFHSKYRSLDGSCNNLDNPSWGAAETPLQYMSEPTYSDGFTVPHGDAERIASVSRGNLRGQRSLPPPREVSTKLLSSMEIEFDSEYTQYFMQWGQFVDHDISLSETMSQEECRELTCQEQDSHWSVCLSIKAAANDTRLNQSTCIGTPRSRPLCGTGETAIFYPDAKPRQVVNSLTSFIDGSQVYGSSDEKSLRLRAGSSEAGRMQELQTTPHAKGIPPLTSSGDVDCPKPRQEHPDRPFMCLLAGDRRINEQLDLTAMHIVWFRQHKHLVQQLSALNRHWGDERVFHEARKIVGAQLQHITYNAWLPKLFGKDNLMEAYTDYDTTVNPSIFSEFSTAAFRFGHAMINPIVRRLDANMQETAFGHLPLREAFFSPLTLLHEGGVDPLIRGMLVTPNKRISPSQILTDELTERLFRFSTLIAEDLGSLNIQRGRDHGLSGYNTFRRMCNLPTFSTFREMSAITDAGAIRILDELYSSPDDLDLWVGGLVERPVGDARVGPLFSCLIKRQFAALRDGDRLWYEREGVFTPQQLREIKKTVLAGVLCENGDNIQRIPLDVFVRSDFPGEFHNCSALPQLDMEPWRECGECELFGACRRRTGRTLPQEEETRVFLYAEGGFQLSSKAAEDRTGKGGRLYNDTTSSAAALEDLRQSMAAPTDEVLEQKTSAGAQFLREVRTWEQLVRGYPDSALAASVRGLVRRVEAETDLVEQDDEVRTL